MIDISKRPEDITLTQYYLISLLSNSKEQLIDYFNTNNQSPEYQYLYELQSLMYIKIIKEDDTIIDIVLRKKATDLFPESKGAAFEEFWDKYHQIIKEWRKSDRFAAEKVWKRMTVKEKNTAIENIQTYYDSAQVIKGRKVVHKARTYLTNKLYNDEFESEDSDWTKNHI